MKPTERQIAARMSRLQAQARAAPGRDLTSAELEAREQCESSLAEFVKVAWGVLEPSRTLLWSPYLSLLCRELEAFSRGETKDLMLLLPPGSMKSLLASCFLPAFEWGPAGQPWRRYVTASYAMQLATRDARRTRELMGSPWYQRLWGDRFRLASDENRLTRYSNDWGGYRLAVSTDSATTGERGDTLVYDDPSQLEAAYYPLELEKANRFFSTTLTSRGVGDDTRRLLVAQRGHPEDVPGRVLAREGEDWRVVILPMRFDPDLRVEAGGKVFGAHPDDGREPGELLNPALMSEKHVRKLEISFGGRAPGVLQQAPAEGGAAIFRREWVRDYFQKEEGGRLEYLWSDPAGARWYSQAETGTFVTVDLASSLGEQADRTCYAAWAATSDGDLLLLDLVWGRIPGEKQLPELRDFCRKWRPWKVLIEAIGYQQAFVSQAAAAVLPGVEPIHRGPRQHKELRASALAVLMSEGRFFVPALVGGEIPPWREDYLAELLAFPTGRHDDVVDVSADAAREVASGGYHLPRPLYDARPDYSRLAGPFGPADPGMVHFDPPFGVLVRFDPPGGF